MANRRKFLTGIGALAAGSAAAVGTGAFTSVRADRTVSVQTANDNDALLALDASGAENADYVETGGGEVSVQLTNSTNYGEDASGVNQNATTRILDLFEVENQGTQEVFMYANAVDNGSGFFADPQASDRPNGSGDSSYGNGEPNNLSQLRDEISLSGRRNVEGGNFPEDDLKGYDKRSFVLGAGESFNFGLYIQGGSSNTDSISDSISINAVSDFDDFGSA